MEKLVQNNLPIVAEIFALLLEMRSPILFFCNRFYFSIVSGSI
ncbi:hypothetical protein FDUTEX481_08063 [Tolypothrix sp. PCC 7601]|nr:hypothetical protein FDUTEX481_08063 [Tolypothrix sp. PCC 7601]